MSRNAADATDAEPRERWAVSFGFWGVLGGCLIATVVFVALTAVMLALAGSEVVSELQLTGDLPRLIALVALSAGAFFLLLGPAVALVVGWMLRREPNQSVHVLAFTIAGAALGVLVGIARGADVAILLGPMIGASAGAARMIMSRFARVIPPAS